MENTRRMLAMEQNSLEQFLDTGWMNGADLFYKGKIYHTECFGNSKKCTAFVYCWHAEKTTNGEYENVFTSEEKQKYSKIFECNKTNEDDARIALLQAPIFNGKTFWEVEDEIEWLEPA